MESDFLSRILTNPDLPAPGKTWMHIRQAMDSDQGLVEVARIVEQDPSLTAQLIGIANSAYMTSATPITSVNRAVMKVGMSMVYHLSLAREMVSRYQQGKARYFDYAGFWPYSVAMGSSMRLLVRERPEPGLTPDDAFVLGLLAPIGWLCLAETTPALFGEDGALRERISMPVQHLSALYLEHIGAPAKICDLLKEPTLSCGSSLSRIGSMLEEVRQLALCLSPFRHEAPTPPEPEVSEGLTAEFNRWSLQLLAA